MMAKGLLKPAAILLVGVLLIGGFFVMRSSLLPKNDSMLKFIPAELRIEDRIIASEHKASMAGGSANISVYKLSDESYEFVQKNSTFFTGWTAVTPTENLCTNAIVFLRDIGQGKDEKVRKYVYSNEKGFSKDNVILRPEEGLIIICRAQW